MKIRFAADILRRLGEELNPSIDRGILELVKNSYDADALMCTVELANADQPGGHIVIKDDGDGMTSHDIEDGWLVLGRSIKEQRTRTRLGRVPAGNKGLGRLAALRMGSRVLLTTRPRTEKASEYNLLIDWDEYKGVELVDDVLLNLEPEPRRTGDKHGTEIQIENLRSKIGRREVKRLAREMLLLADPFGDDPKGFKPILKAPEFEDLEALVQNRYFQDADFHLIAKIDKDGRVSAQVLDWRDAILYSADHDELASKKNKLRYACPELTFELWTFLWRTSSFVARSAPMKDSKAWVEAFGGVHIYQNGLRVTPYGDPGNDWLDMNLSRVRSPEERPSTNNSIGRVLFNDAGSLLVQKTDRSGFIESDTFLEIRDYAQDALDWMAGRRMEEAQKRREHEKAEVTSKTAETRRQSDAAMEDLPKEAKETIKKAFRDERDAVDKEIQHYQQEIQLYRTLSTAGITSATFAHESAGNPIKVIDQSIATVERRARTHLPEVYESQLKKPVDRIKGATGSLSVLGKATLKLLDHEKRRPARVEIHEVIDKVLGTYAPFLDPRHIAVDAQYCDASPYLRGSEAAVESIVTNLINNSVAAFERSENKERKILIKTEVTNGYLRLRVADSGPGIEEISKREIWLPGRTTRKNGTGLGLTIVRDTVKDLGGEVDAIEHGEFGGAEIFIQLPILGV
ncbi:MAG: ATP-binding protein [Armatimonadetes bacterium]|nr:ATP-binding protein [Armatimonadota bacterium]